MIANQFPGGHSEREPPDPISNSEVKTLSADASVGSPHVKVGHCQDFIPNPSVLRNWGVFYCHVVTYLNLGHLTIFLDIIGSVRVPYEQFNDCLTEIP